MGLPDILFGMSTSIQTNTNFNPYSAPPTPRAESPQRASQQKIRRVNRLSIVADLSYVAVCLSFGLALYFYRGEAAQYSFVAYAVTSFLLWYSVVAGLFRAKGISIESIVTTLILPMPLFGTAIFLLAKSEIRNFMIVNGYRPRFLGFVIDDAQRQAMDQDPNYTPSKSTHHDGSRRCFVPSLSECWLILCFGGYTLISLIPLLSSLIQF